jgi:hypothetical protein
MTYTLWDKSTSTQIPSTHALFKIDSAAGTVTIGPSNDLTWVSSTQY